MRKLFVLLLISQIARGQSVQFGGNVTVGGNATVAGTPGPSIASSSPLPVGNQNIPYQFIFAGTGGVQPYVWTKTLGTLPSGMTLNASTGALQGTDTLAETASFTIQLADANGLLTTKAFSVTINAAGGSIISNSNCLTTPGGMDGPSHLPLVYLCSSEANTPRSGAITAVPNGNSLQTAYNNASCGDWLQTAAGGSYTISSLASKGCSDSQWIWIGPAHSGSQPAEGVTTNPCFSNTATVAGYNYPCSAPVAATSKITISPSGTINDSGDHIRWENIEFAKGAGGLTNNMFTPGAGATKQVFDRIWAHGNAHEEMQRFVLLDASTQFQIVDSYFSDFHCVSSTGFCTDSQVVTAVSGGSPAKVSHNFLSASSEHILFGGGDFKFGVPSDIEVSYNTLFRPFTWNPACTTVTSCPGGVLYDGGVGGHAYVVKNTVEFKNGQRILLEKNKYANNWGGFSQVGNMYTISPKNQAIGTSNLCPQCLTKDITIRYEKVSYYGQLFQIFNAGNGNAQFALEGNTYSIHDIIADHGSYNGCNACASYLNQFNTAVVAPSTAIIHDVTVNHVTEVIDNLIAALMAVGGPITPIPMSNIVWENSILPAGQFGIGSVGGQTNQCAFTPAASTPKAQACAVSFTFTHNGIPYGNGHGGTWNNGTDSTQILTADQNAVLYTDLAGGNYLLQVTSPFHNQATDGTDIGANVAAVNAAIANTPY